MKESEFFMDSPIKSASEDRFSRMAFAERIARSISKRKDNPDPITIGLHGNWGSGKTSLLNLVEELLRKDSSIIVVRFNPWLFNGVENVLLGFFKSLSNALIGERAVIAIEGFKKIAKTLLPVVSPAIGVPGIQSVLTEFLSEGSDINQLRSDIEADLKRTGKHFLIMVDDIDRLDKYETQEILKVIKIAADFRHTTYLLAFDRDVVSASLSERYPHGKGDEFLEKIIQVPLHLPVVSKTDLMDLCFFHASKILGLPEADKHAFARKFYSAFEEDITTPRHVKLYGNALAFSLPILNGEVNPIDLMLLEGIRIFVPELYEAIRNNKRLFVEGVPDSYQGEGDRVDFCRGKIESIFNSTLRDVQKERRDNYIGLIKYLFPKMNEIYITRIYGESPYKQYVDDKHICTNEYFDRYFRHSISKEDFSDIEIGNFVSRINEIGDLSIDNNPLNSIITHENKEMLFTKLRRKISSYDESQSKSLSLAISLLDKQYLDTPHASFYDCAGFTSIIAIIIDGLIMNMKRSERVPQAIECIKISPSLSLKAGILRWLRREKEGKFNEGAFTDDEINEIGRVLAGCLKSFIEEVDNIMEEEINRDVVRHVFYLLNEYGHNPVVVNHVEKVLKRDASQIIRLLYIYNAADVWVLGTGMPLEADFEIEQHDAIIDIFPPEFILGAIRKHLGDLPEESDFPRFPRNFGGDVDGSILARQFLWLHRNKMKQDNDKNADDEPPKM